jgi:hypothetical protein
LSAFAGLAELDFTSRLDKAELTLDLRTGNKIMNTSTGQIQNFMAGEQIPSGWIEVKRHLTIRESIGRQINKYAPCACGSGKKFKFCHYKKFES